MSQYKIPKRFSHCIFYDMGHGAIDPKTNKYTTRGKQFDHGPDYSFHNDGNFYEGQKNRDYGYAVTKKLVAKGVNVVIVNHPWKDTSLQSRVELANYYHKNIQKGFYYSQHSNAISNPKHNATGVAIYTSRSNNLADKFADKFYEMFKEEFPDVKYRAKFSDDGDSDREAGFYVLVRTAMLASLMENLFFDNHKDAKLLMSENYFERYVQLEADWLFWVVTQLDKLSKI